MRTIVFFDGQNLYHLARTAWAPFPPVVGSPYGYPSYDVEKLAAALSARDPRRVLSQTRFYTGVPLAKGRRILAWLLVKQTEIPRKPRYQRLQGTNQSWRPGKGRRRKYCSRSCRTYLRPIIRSRYPRKPRLGFRTSCRTRQENCKGTKTLPGVRVCLPIPSRKGLVSEGRPGLQLGSH